MVLAYKTSKSALSEDAVESKQKMAISSKRLQELADTELNYPGWERDHEEAREAFPMASSQKFPRILRKAKDIQLLTRIDALVSLELDYPGYEEDRRKVMAWSRKHPFNEDMAEVFQDKLQGLINKSQLYRGDRSHPNIIELDKLHFSFPGWEKAYKRTISAHCEEPARMFLDAFWRIRENQYTYDDNRSHWRLVALDALKLTYPGFAEDIAKVKNWHSDHADDSPSSKSLFNEVVDGMLEQENIYLESKLAKEEERVFLDHGEEDQVDEEEDASTSSDSAIDSVAIEVGWRCRSISELLKRVEAQIRAIGVEKRQGETEMDVAPEEQQKVSASLKRVEAQRRAIGVEKRQGKTERDVAPEEQQRVSASLKRVEAQRRAIGVERRQGKTVRAGGPEEQQKVSASLKRVEAQRRAIEGEKRQGEIVRDVAPEEQQKEPAHAEFSFGRCVVCRKDSRTHIFLPCGHLCACAACSKHAFTIASCCPACGKKADQAQKVFLASS